MAEWLKKIAANAIRRTEGGHGAADAPHDDARYPTVVEERDCLRAEVEALRTEVRRLTTEHILWMSAAKNAKTEKAELVEAIRDCANGGPCAKFALSKATATEGEK